MGVVTKISIKCKALDANPMFSALFSNAILNISSLISQSQPMGMKFLEWRFCKHIKKYENYIFLTLMVGQKTLSQ